MVVSILGCVVIFVRQANDCVHHSMRKNEEIRQTKNHFSLFHSDDYYWSVGIVDFMLDSLRND